MLERVTPACTTLILLGGCANTTLKAGRGFAPDRTSAHHSIDRWHDAAARGDSAAYFGLMTEDAVFLGTDATERWTRDEFAAFAKPYFDRPGEPAWVYVPRERHVATSDDERTLWFDELLDNPKYGTARGSGVLVRGEDGVWRIAQYNLSFPIPNDLAGEFTERIKRYEERRR